MIIRKATLKDFKSVQELVHKLILKEFKDYDPLLKPKWIFSKAGVEDTENYIIKPTHCTFVAEVDKKIVGYIMGELLKNELWRKITTKAKMESFFVLEKYRGQGIGTKLNNAFNKWCKENNVKLIKVVVTAQNEAATRFYRKAGFKDYELTLEKPL